MESLIKTDDGKDNPDNWRFEIDGHSSGISKHCYSKYSSELFGLLTSLTAGEAQTILKGMVDAGHGNDGFKALRIFNRRFDSITPSGMLQAFVGVVDPPKCKSELDISQCVHAWEAKVALLNSRHNEKISDGLKLAILVSMVPLEFQNLIMQHGSGRLADMKYNVQRDYLLNLAEQKLQLKKPSPTGVNNVNEESDWENSTDVDSWYSWYNPSDIDFVGKGKGKKGGW